MRRAVAIALFFTAASVVAQVPPRPPGLPCTIADTPAAILPDVAIADLVSDIVIKCEGGTPTPSWIAIPQITLRLYLNTNITSRLFATSPDISEALLLIDEPAPVNQLVCPRLPCAMPGTGGGANNPYDGSSGRYNVFQATQVQANVLEWAGVPFDPPGPGRTRTLRITNVRADLNSVRCTANPNCLPILTGFMGFASPTPLLYFDRPQITLGSVAPALRFTTMPATLPASTDHNLAGNRLSADLTIQFAEGLAAVFKQRTVSDRPDDVSPNANQNVPGKQYGTASGFYNASFGGSASGAGLASQGTRLVARFQGIPQGVNIYVTAQPVSGSKTLRVQMISAGPKGDGPYDPITADGSGFVPLTVYTGQATAVWEVVSASPADVENVQFGVAISFAGDNSANPRNLGTATVRGSLGPISDIEIASLTDPVPRYTEGGAQPAFTITNRGTPAIAGIVNAANFAPGGAVAPGSIAAIFGAYLSTGAGGGYGTVVPVSQGSTTVHINGIAAPIYWASPGQVNVQIPWELAGQTAASVVVDVDTLQSAPFTVKVADTAPYIFSYPSGEGIIARAFPAQPGGILKIYATGLGPVRNPPRTGAAAIDETSATIATPLVTIAGVRAEVAFSGLAAGIPGVYEVRVTMPEGVPAADSAAVKLTIAGVESNSVSMRLR